MRAERVGRYVKSCEPPLVLYCNWKLKLYLLSCEATPLSQNARARRFATFVPRHETADARAKREERKTLSGPHKYRLQCVSDRANTVGRGGQIARPARHPCATHAS